MEVTVNQQLYYLEQSCSVTHMLTAVLKTETKGIAVAINQTIIPKSQWPVRVLEQDDQVILIKATQGG